MVRESNKKDSKKSKSKAPAPQVSPKSKRPEASTDEKGRSKSAQLPSANGLIDLLGIFLSFSKCS
jgi:hypothetical protein